MMRRVALLAAALLASSAAAQPDPRAQLLAARRDAAAAAARAAALDRSAAAARDSAARAKLQAGAIAARIAAGQAEVVAARARVTLIRRAVADQRARLARSQGPVARLLAALQSLAGRPALVAVAQPGSVDDLVHVRAVLGSAIPTIRARTAGARADLARTRALAADAAVAAGALIDRRAQLERYRLALVRLEAEQRLRAANLGRGALRESDQALALGEEARDLIDQLADDRDAAAVQARLASLGGPLPRPNGAGDAATGAAAAYRLPAAGRIVTGFGEVSDAGVRSRGLTIATAPSAAVLAPAGGRIVYAAPFRRYGGLVVIDHGAGWLSALVGLGGITVRTGERVAAGATIGRAQAGASPRLTVELRRHGRPVEPAALIG